MRLGAAESEKQASKPHVCLWTVFVSAGSEAVTALQVTFSR